jgi:hypothetical protein
MKPTWKLLACTSHINFCVPSTFLLYENSKIKSNFTVPNYSENKSAKHLIKLKSLFINIKSVRNNIFSSAKFGTFTVHGIIVFQMHHISLAITCTKILEVKFLALRGGLRRSSYLELKFTKTYSTKWQCDIKCLKFTESPCPPTLLALTSHSSPLLCQVVTLFKQYKIFSTINDITDMSHVSQSKLFHKLSQ